MSPSRAATIVPPSTGVPDSLGALDAEADAADDEDGAAEADAEADGAADADAEADAGADAEAEADGAALLGAVVGAADDGAGVAVGAAVGAAVGDGVALDPLQAEKMTTAPVSKASNDRRCGSDCIEPPPGRDRCDRVVPGQSV
jgi:hypothetical protein